MAPRDDGEADGGFLARWSRRKREVEPPAAPAAPGPLPAEPPGGAAVAQTAPAAEPEMVEPPSLDLIDKDFDVSHWLGQNVPESWKLAAMRRAWESDPAIAGFENPARDYALDWNTPGGAPGYGPLAESDDVEAMVRAIFGDTPTPSEDDSMVAEATGDAMPHPETIYDESLTADAASQQNRDAGVGAGHIRLSEEVGSVVKGGENKASHGDEVYVAAQNSTVTDPPQTRVRKRGGGATPH